MVYLKCLYPHASTILHYIYYIYIYIYTAISFTNNMILSTIQFNYAKNIMKLRVVYNRLHMYMQLLIYC